MPYAPAVSKTKSYIVPKDEQQSHNLWDNQIGNISQTHRTQPSTEELDATSSQLLLVLQERLTKRLRRPLVKV